MNDKIADLPASGSDPELCCTRLTGATATEQAEIDRVEAAGGWVEDERVCDILMVSRAFGDADFKGEGLHRLLSSGVKCVCACLHPLGYASSQHALQKDSGMPRPLNTMLHSISCRSTSLTGL